MGRIACGRWCRCASSSSTCSPHHCDLVPDNPVASSHTNFLLDIWEGKKRKLCTPTSRNTFPISKVHTGIFSRTYILSFNICLKINFDRTVGVMCNVYLSSVLRAYYMPVIPYKCIKNKPKVDVLAPKTCYRNTNYAYKENETADMI